jgi:hypothetical protein
MAGTISNFLSSFKGDIARPSRFDVEIPVPLKLVSYRNTGQRLTLRCENAELPSRTFATAERKIYGPTELHPYLTNYNQSTFTFIVSEDMLEKKLFDAWMDLINPRSTFNLAYKKDYITDITVNQYDLQNNKTYSVSLNEAFPLSVNQLDLDWGNETSYHKLSVVFAYYTWERNDIEGLAAEIFNAGIVSAVDAGVNFLNSSFSGQPNDSATIYDMKSIASKIDSLQ